MPKMTTESLAPNRRDKYKQIFEMLYSDLLSGRYVRGQKIPNAVDLAKQYKVSRPTISRAIEELEKKGMLIRRQGAGTFVANTAVVASSKLAVMAPGFKVEPAEFKEFATLFGQVISHIAQASHGTEYVLLMNELPVGFDEDEALAHAKEICQQLIAMQVRGVFFVPFNVSAIKEKINAEIVNTFKNAGVCVTLIDRDIYEYPQRSSCDLVEIDNRRASYQLTEHLLKLGCRKIAFITGPDPASTVRERVHGYEDALRHFDIEPDRSNLYRFGLLPMSQPDSDAEFEFFKQTVDTALADAFICSTDRLASIFMRSLSRMKIRVPEDIRLVSFDDEPFAEYLPVPLTTIRQPVEIIGAEAFRLMKARIEDPQRPVQTVTLGTDLVVRQSCGAKLSTSE